MGMRTATAALFLTLLTCAAAAQQPTTTARVGMLCPFRCAWIGYTAFNDELRKLGLLLPLELPTASQYCFQVDMIEAGTLEDFPGTIAQAKALGADALLSVGDPDLNTPPNRIPDLTLQAALPSIYQTREVVQAGGLISYSPDFLGVTRRHAHYVDRILRGASPSGLPVEQPTTHELIINLKTAKALGLTVPPSLLSQADEVIE